MKPKQFLFLAIALFVIAGCQKNEPTGPWFGNGVHNGWADHSSVVIWTRLTQNPDLNYSGTAFLPLKYPERAYLDSLGNKDSIHSAQIPEGLGLDEMEGACPGMEGEVRLSYYPEGLESNTITSGWSAVDPDKNYTYQWDLGGLSAGMRYEIVLESRNPGSKKTFTSISGSFQTPPEKESSKDLTTF